MLLNKETKPINVVAIEKGALGLPSTKVANFTYFTYFLFVDWFGI